MPYQLVIYFKDGRNASHTWQVLLVDICGAA